MVKGFLLSMMLILVKYGMDGDGAFSRRWVDTGRQVISALLCRSEKDPQNFAMAYDGLVEFLSEDENVVQMTEELASRNVQCCNFYDIVLDYILVDSFEDLESPPSSVLAVMKNRWLSDGFKESALHTAIWDEPQWNTLSVISIVLSKNFLSFILPRNIKSNLFVLQRL